MEIKHQIVIVGGGNAGISVAARLLKKDKTLDVVIIDPSDKHYSELLLRNSISAFAYVGVLHQHPERVSYF